MIKKLLNENGTIGDLKIGEMKELLNIKRLPDKKNYTSE